MMRREPGCRVMGKDVWRRASSAQVNRIEADHPRNFTIHRRTACRLVSERQPVALAQRHTAPATIRVQPWSRGDGGGGIKSLRRRKARPCSYTHFCVRGFRVGGYSRERIDPVVSACTGWV